MEGKVFTEAEKRRVLQAAELVLGRKTLVFPPSLGRSHRGGESRIWCAPVERSALLSSGGVAYRWKYKLQRIALTDSDTIAVVDSDTTFGTYPDVYALNEMELSNQAQHVGYQTTGVNQADPYPDGFFIEPIGGGSGSTATVLVPTYARLATRPDGSTVWLFSSPNAENGSCE